MANSNIPNIVLTDTFNTWVARSNTVIDSVNDLRNGSFFKDGGNFIANGDVILTSNGTLILQKTGATSLLVQGSAQVQQNLSVGSIGDIATAISSAANTVLISSNSGSTRIANSINFVNTSTVTVSVGAGVGSNANISFNVIGGVGGGNGTANLTVSDIPPVSPRANQDFWWQSNTGSLKIYYNDGTSQQWVDAGIGGGSGTGNGTANLVVSDSPPATARANQDFWWQSNTGSLKIYYNDGTSQQWVDTVASSGAQGTQGTQGVQGVQGFGLQGAQGVQGTSGIQGSTGSLGNQLTVSDTRAVTTTPETLTSPKVSFDFKQLTSEGISDSGTYFAEMTIRPYGTGTDWSGGASYQLGFAQSGNVWLRNGTSTSWGAWSRLGAQGIQGVQGTSVQGVQGPVGGVTGTINSGSTTRLAFYSGSTALSDTPGVQYNTTNTAIEVTGNVRFTGNVIDTPILSISTNSTYADNAAGKIIVVDTSGGDKIITFAPATVSGFAITIVRKGTSNVTIANTSLVSRLNVSTYTTSNLQYNYSTASVIYTATNEIILIGDIK